MTLSDYKSKYQGLSQADVQQKALYQPDEEFKIATEQLYRAYFRQPLNKSCGNCWCDAYVLLMLETSNKIMETQRLFDLKAGAMLYDVVNGDNSKLCTTLNITDDLALYHLSKNPGYISKFSVYPEDWQKRVNDYIAEHAATKAVSQAQSEPEAEDKEIVAEAPKAVKSARKSKSKKTN